MLFFTLEEQRASENDQQQRPQNAPGGFREQTGIPHQKEDSNKNEK